MTDTPNAAALDEGALEAAARAICAADGDDADQYPDIVWANRAAASAAIRAYLAHAPERAADKARIAELEAGLGPFADAFVAGIYSTSVTVGEYRQAARLLTPPSSDQPEGW